MEIIFTGVSPLLERQPLLGRLLGERRKRVLGVGDVGLEVGQLLADGLEAGLELALGEEALGRGEMK